MNTYLDGALVGLMVFASVVYATFSLGPKNLRRRVLLAVSSLLGRGPKWARLGGAAQRLASTAQSTKGSCGGCDDCGSAAASAPAIASAPATAAASGRELRNSAASQLAGEIKIPLSKIGRRRNGAAQR